MSYSFASVLCLVNEEEKLAEKCSYLVEESFSNVGRNLWKFTFRGEKGLLRADHTDTVGWFIMKIEILKH